MYVKFFYKEKDSGKQYYSGWIIKKTTQSPLYERNNVKDNCNID